MANFCAQFNPDGDMLYGRGEEITRYLKEYQRFNRGSTAKVRDRYPYAFINNYNMMITNTFLCLNQGQVLIDKKGAPLTEKQREYHEALRDSFKYSPDTTLRDVAPMLTSLKKSNVNLDETNQKQVAMASKDLAIRRSSKFGIQFAIMNLGAAVHYILDGITMSVVVNKEALKNESVGLMKVPIVTSELRHVFRLWNFYKTHKLYFYKDFLTTIPPWNDTSDKKALEGWATYARQRVAKYKDKIPAPYMHGLDKAIDDLTYIQAFHDIPHYICS
ncbi:MAG: hypothetical protein P4L56_17095 [Candidatus Sulfopaludibacter sp.]|nr:hypothetical protein [Candidatus Sulfopaludibacter sp.]